MNKRPIYPNRLPSTYLLSLACVAISAAAGQAADWQTTLTRDPPGNFPPPRPLRAVYTFGWSGFTAASADVHFNRTADNRYQLLGTGRTTGLVRALWRYDVTHQALAGDTLNPIELTQAETFRSKKVSTHLVFNPTGVNRSRTEAGKTSTKVFNFTNLFDLQSAMLYVRSQPLKEHSVTELVVYPATTPYLVHLTVTGREKISVRAGSYNAIKMDLQLNRVGKNLQLEPHRKFRKATIWVSDDPDRIIVRIEAQIFVGTVFAELQSVRFDAPQS